MNSNNYLKDIYNDFFGIGDTLNKEPTKNDFSPNQEESSKDITTLLKRIDQLSITAPSKELLKKIIQYMQKYQQKEELNDIPFSILLEVNNDETKNEIESLLYEAIQTFSYINNPNRKDISLYQLEQDLNLSNLSFITIHDLEGIALEGLKEQTKFYHQLEELLKKNRKMILLLSGTKKELSNFFLGKEKIRDQYFKFSIIESVPELQALYQEVLTHLNLNEPQKIELLDYMQKTYLKEEDYLTYQNNLINYISFHKEIPKIEQPKTLEEIFAELNELVGLEKVKKVLHELVEFMNLKEKAGDTLNLKSVNLHMVFLGNPGTGKTTIARLIANILYQLKYIKENKIVEVSSKDLVAEYVGQTAPKTMQVIEKSLNGVLFIDEAYTLASKDTHSYQAEAVATLIQAMENHRDQFVVIFAGYTKEMQEFLNSNSGIASRIGYTLEFDDYTTDELIQIFRNMMTKSGFEVEKDAIKYVEEIITQYRDTENFGNARFVRNIYEKTIIKHATNVKDKKQKRILKTITKDDISIEHLMLK